MTLGQRVKRHRVQLGLTTTEAAQRAGLDSGYWSRLENDKYEDIGHTRLTRIAATLSCTVAELLGEPVVAPLTPEQKQWLGLLEMLPRRRFPDACAEVARMAAEGNQASEDMEAAEDFAAAMI